MGRRQYADHLRPAVSDPSELQVELQAEAEGPGLVPCYQQQEPARQLVNLTDIPVLFMNGEGGYHRIFDHCLANWLNQAGVDTEYVRMEDVGLPGNGHMMMLELNSKEIAEYIHSWLETNILVKEGGPMPQRILISCLAIGATVMLIAGPAQSHHGDAGRYNDHVTTVVGVVAQWRLINPHSVLILDVEVRTGASCAGAVSSEIQPVSEHALDGTRILSSR